MKIRSYRFAILIVTACAAACATKAPPASQPTAAPATSVKPSSPTSSRAANDKSARTPPTLVDVLRRLPVAGDRRRPRFAIALTGWSEPLALWQGLRRALLTTPTGTQVLGRAEVPLLQLLGSAQLTAALLRKKAQRFGIALDGPAGAVIGPQVQAVFTLHDAPAFRAAVVALLGKVLPAAPTWHPDAAARAHILRLVTPHGTSTLLACRFVVRGLVSCAQDVGHLSAELPAGQTKTSVYDQLSALQRKTLDGANPPHVVLWGAPSAAGPATATSPHITVSATARLQGGIEANVEIHGVGELGYGPAAVVPLDVVSRTLPEAIYLRLPPDYGHALLIKAGVPGVGHEALITFARGCPLMLFGVTGPQVAAKLLAALARQKKLLVSGVPMRPRRVRGQLVLEAPPQVAGQQAVLAATRVGLLGCSRSCLARAQKWAQGLPTSVFAPQQRKGPQPIVAAKLVLGDALSTVLPRLRMLFGATIPPEFDAFLPVARSLAAQLFDARVVLYAPTSGAPTSGPLHATVRIRSRHRGAQDDAARALWHRALAARLSGDRPSADKLVRLIEAQAPKSRYARALRRPPLLLSGLLELLASTAGPAVRGSRAKPGAAGPASAR